MFEGTKHCYIGALPTDIAFDQRGIWALADNSGHFPQDTDDGVLWLDFRRDLSAGAPVTEINDGSSPSIPLLDKSGQPFSTITDVCTLLVLSIRFNWHINCLGTIVRAIES